MRIIYIHGFNSFIGSTTAAKLRALELLPLFELGYPSNGMFNHNLQSLKEQYNALTCEDSILLGTSLGGFYVSQLADMPHIKALVMINPVIFPESDLAQFLGNNKNFCTHQNYIFTEEQLHSYHSFPDKRSFPLQRHLLLALGDTLLNPSIARSYYDAYASLHLMTGSHRLDDFELVKCVIQNIINSTN